MSKTTYTAGVDLFLVDGEIYLLGKPVTCKQGQAVYVDSYPHIGYLENEKSDDLHPIFYSTKQIEGVHLLDRNRFVKGEDLEEMINENCELRYFDSRESAVYSEGFKSGYKANKNEFTREEMAAAIGFGINLAKYSSVNNQDVLDLEYEGFLRELRPLSLPTSVTIENNEIIEVKWK